MKAYSRGFAAPGAVIFLAVIGIVVWYRHHNEGVVSAQSTTTPQHSEARIAGEGVTSTIR